MMWLVWRQQRTQVLTSIGIIGAIILMWIYLLIESADCTSQATCDAPFLREFSEQFPYYSLAMPIVCFALGVFAGAPLFAREFEERTHAFVITQNGRRGRWISAKLLISSVPVIAMLTALGVISAIAHDRMWLPNPLLQPTAYPGNGPLLVGWFLLAFAFSAIIGVIGRRTLLAMVVAIVGVIPTAVLVAQFVRPALVPPERVTMDVSQIESDSADSFIPSPDTPEGSTVMGDGYLAANGDEALQCARPNCDVEVVTSYTDYYWDDDFWTLQAFDLGCYAVVSIIVLAGAVILMRRIQI